MGTLRKIALIVDDHPDLRCLMCILLAEADFECQEACCAEEAIDLLASGTHPDLIVTDLHMKKMSGRDLLGYVRRSAEFRGVPVLLVTSDIHGERIARESGFDSFVGKP